MSMDRLINVLVTVTLIEMMLTAGLGVMFADLAGVLRDWRLVAWAALANYVCVPAATLGLIFLFGTQPMVAAGLLILAVCPGAPYGPPFAAVAKGNTAVAVGLMLLLAGSSALIAPLLLYGLLPLVSAGEPLEVHAGRIVGTLLATQLLPLGIGIAVRQWRPLLAERLRNPGNLLSKILNLAAVGLIVVARFDSFTVIGPRSFLSMLALLVASWAAGWLLGGPGAANRKVMTLTTALRNVGVGLVIATGSFAGTPAVSAAVVYGLFEVLGSLLLARVWSRREAVPVLLPTRDH